MRNPYHPDDSGMTWQNGGGKNGGNGNGKGYGAGFRIVMPAETRTLAEDMADEFGGSVGGWRRNINQPAPTFNFGGGHAGGHGGGNRPGGNNPGGHNDPGGGGSGPSSPRNRMMAYQMPMQSPFQMQRRAPMQFGQPMAPAMPMQIPQQGLLGNPMMAQPQPQRGLLGDIPPEVLAYIRTGA